MSGKNKDNLIQQNQITLNIADLKLYGDGPFNTIVSDNTIKYHILLIEENNKLKDKSGGNNNNDNERLKKLIIENNELRSKIEIQQTQLNIQQRKIEKLENENITLSTKYDNLERLVLDHFVKCPYK